MSWVIVGSSQTFGSAKEDGEAKNPLAGNASAIQEGKSLFRSGCGLCHGNEGRGGGRGPDLSAGRWVHGGNDATLFRTITRGVPGTQMPANDLTEEETWMIIAYLRSMESTATPVSGNREAGETIFYNQGFCSKCHMVTGKGGRLGPDLSRVGASRPLQYLVEAIREPNKHLAEALQEPGREYLDVYRAYDTVTVLTRDGKRITGIAKNEDNFTLQLMDQNEKFHLFLRKNLKEVIHERKSLMPAYDEQMLDQRQLEDLLAYLVSLRGQ